MPPPSSLRGVRAALLSLCLTACGAGWKALPSVQPGALPARQQVQVWQGGHPHRLHDVMISEDSISGIPFTRPPEDERARVSLPRASVDSVRVGNPVAGFWKTIGLILGTTTLASCLAGWCGMSSD
jgi:hypothetical protein